MPFDNFPTIWNERQRGLAKKCTWRSGIIEIDINGMPIREVYGLQPEKYVFITIDSNVNTTTNNHGVKIADIPGYYTIPIRITSDASNTQQQFNLSIYVYPPDVPSAGFKVDINTTEATHTSATSTAPAQIIEVDFTADTLIPASYVYIEDSQVGPQGKIDVLLYAFEGFDDDLKFGYSTGDELPCYPISGITGDLTCVYTAGNQAKK